jgi:hypothetical protein
MNKYDAQAQEHGDGASMVERIAESLPAPPGRA